MSSTGGAGNNEEERRKQERRREKKEERDLNYKLNLAAFNAEYGKVDVAGHMLGNNQWLRDQAAKKRAAAKAQPPQAGPAAGSASEPMTKAQGKQKVTDDKKPGQSSG